jgi:hypothetical protein
LLASNQTTAKRSAQPRDFRPFSPPVPVFVESVAKTDVRLQYSTPCLNGNLSVHSQLSLVTFSYMPSCLRPSSRSSPPATSTLSPCSLEDVWMDPLSLCLRLAITTLAILQLSPSTLATPSLPLRGSAAAHPPTPPSTLSSRQDAPVEVVRGVSLGGWLVTESWFVFSCFKHRRERFKLIRLPSSSLLADRRLRITPSLYESTGAPDEWNLCNSLGKNCQKRLNSHYECVCLPPLASSCLSQRLCVSSTDRSTHSTTSTVSKLPVSPTFAFPSATGLSSLSLTSSLTLPAPTLTSSEPLTGPDRSGLRSLSTFTELLALRTETITLA